MENQRNQQGDMVDNQIVNKTSKQRKEKKEKRKKIPGSETVEFQS
jgi:hypothetical protein